MAYEVRPIVRRGVGPNTYTHMKPRRVANVLEVLFFCALLACGGTAGSAPDAARDAAPADAAGSDAGRDETEDAGTGDGGVATVLLRYHYGNQIVGSQLSIEVTGSVAHEERTCCPPTFSAVAQSPLGATDLEQLRHDIDAVTRAVTVEALGEPSSAGSKSGELVVYGRNGRPYIVREIRRTSVERDAVTATSAPEGRRILGLVDRYVVNRMYR